MKYQDAWEDLKIKVDEERLITRQLKYNHAPNSMMHNLMSSKENAYDRVLSLIEVMEEIHE